ncbi:xanthine dehydrogenase accessory factor [Streptomyces sp. LBL]|uniref:XdhC family protein n=1 Tax=Streptomyces sp. LBL TaxID=2940562 RepID=UPI002476F1E3|nr:XdhC family protein [Streptomyces sp. LBL]MDH6622987.1 xanthine dehydrogenase accessory factor [Streptomyces sp. LBL]
MLDIAEELHRWAEEGREFAVATVVAVGGSAPRGPGAALAVDGAGTVIGSVSGGCVEGAVYDLCMRALQEGATVVERFGYSDEDAFAVGLTCGGIIDIMVTPVRADAPARPVFRSALSAAAEGEPTAVARVVRGPAELLGRPLVVRPSEARGGSLRTGSGAGSYEGGLGGSAELDRTAAAEARALLETGRTGTVELSADGSRCPGGLTLLVESSVPPPRMIVFGAVDFAAALVRVGKFLGYHVTVCDARPVFATRARFPEADDVVVDWPHRYLLGTATDARTVLCVLTHDAKFDVPLLAEALRMPVAFVGAMGSRRTHTDRERRLREVGLTDGELARLRSPIGLDLGARTPEETALSIAAEIVATRWGGTGTPLTGSGTPIHHEEADGAGTSPGRPARNTVPMRSGVPSLP